MSTISVQAHFAASRSVEPLSIEAHVNSGNGRPFDVIYINDFSMHLNRAQTMQLQAELTRFIAAVQSPEPRQEAATKEGGE